MAEAMALADRIGVIDHGALIWCDASGAIADCNDPRVRRFVDAATPLPRADGHAGVA